MAEDDIALTIGELAAMVGMSTDTIRAWERRHGVLSARRTPAGHRRYRMEDVETLRRIRHSVAALGLSLKLAAAEARGLALDDPPRPPLAEPDIDPARGASEAPWRAVGDLLPNVLCILDESGGIIDANIAFARMAGILRPRLRGMRFLDLVEPPDRAKAARLYRPRPSRRRDWELNLRTPKFSGLFSVDTHVVTTMTGAFVVVIGRDLSSAGGALALWPEGVEPGHPPPERMPGRRMAAPRPHAAV